MPTGGKAIFDLLVRVELQAARVVPVYRALDAQIGCWAEIEVSGGGESYALRHAVDAGHITPYVPPKNSVSSINSWLSAHRPTEFIWFYRLHIFFNPFPGILRIA